MYTVTAATLEYMIKNMPVEELTIGGTPIPIKYGLKITPPPRPNAPATKPPPKPRRETFLIILPVKTRSLGTILMFPNLRLSAYSPPTNFTAKCRMTPLMTTKVAIVAQSSPVHLSKTIFLNMV